MIVWESLNIIMRTRLEKDSMGRYQVPSHAYYGVFTARALKNFQLSGQKAPRIYIKALGLVKEACAEVNMDLGLIEKKEAHVIILAAREFANGKFDEDFPIDAIQAGAGTPFNMNANEIIANRANQLLGKPLGSYSPIHPNNHVNMSQSSNDVTPTSLRIAALFLVMPLIETLEKLNKSFIKISEKYEGLIKVGRTHLQDAVPMTVGQEFNAYATMLRKSKERILSNSRELLEIGLGGTALGSGINTHPSFQKKVVGKLSKLTRFPLTASKDLFEMTSNMNVFVSVSGALRMLANDLIKISNDFKLLSMGPIAGVSEYILPEVEPGSSIMPGKINPSVAEAAQMAALDAIASDQAIAMAASGGQLQLNVLTPLIIKHLLYSLQLLSNTCEMLRKECVDGISVNVKNVASLYEKSLVTATALSPYLGYEVTAELVKEALSSGRSIVYVIRQKKFMDDADLDNLLRIDRIAKPAILDLNLRRKIQKSENYQKYKSELGR